MLFIMLFPSQHVFYSLYRRQKPPPRQTLQYPECLAGGNDCTIDGVCPGDSADRSVVVDAYNTEDTACLDAFTNCINDSECLGCVDVVPGDCSAETATNVCGAVSEMLCCAYGTNTVCQTNGPLIAYTGTCVCFS